MMGYYLLIQFLQYGNRDISYVPQQLTAETLQFFDTQCKWLSLCANKFEYKANCITAWSAVEQLVTETVQSMSKP